MRVLSHSDTHHLNGYMGWCGCHEIFIQRSITVLFWSKFSLYLTQLWFWWLSYSNHSFQLISIQYSVHQSDSARNHSYRPSNECWLIFRDISPLVIRAKRVSLLHQLRTKSTHYWAWKPSLCRKDRRTIFLTTAKTKGMSRWLWQASISFSRLIQSLYSESNQIYYRLPSLVQNTMRCCLEYICISHPMFECEWATNLFRRKLVNRWIRWVARGKILQLPMQLIRWRTRNVPNLRSTLTWMDITF